MVTKFREHVRDGLGICINCAKCLDEECCVQTDECSLNKESRIYCEHDYRLVCYYIPSMRQNVFVTRCSKCSRPKKF